MAVSPKLPIGPRSAAAHIPPKLCLTVKESGEATRVLAILVQLRDENGEAPNISSPSTHPAALAPKLFRVAPLGSKEESEEKSEEGSEDVFFI